MFFGRGTSELGTTQYQEAPYMNVQVEEGVWTLSSHIGQNWNTLEFARVNSRL